MSDKQTKENNDNNVKNTTKQNNKPNRDAHYIPLIRSVTAPVAQRSANKHNEMTSHRNEQLSVSRSLTKTNEQTTKSGVDESARSNDKSTSSKKKSQGTLDADSTKSRNASANKLSSIRAFSKNKLGAPTTKISKLSDKAGYRTAKIRKHVPNDDDETEAGVSNLSAVGVTTLKASDVLSSTSFQKHEPVITRSVCSANENEASILDSMISFNESLTQGGRQASDEPSPSEELKSKSFGSSAGVVPLSGNKTGGKRKDAGGVTRTSNAGGLDSVNSDSTQETSNQQLMAPRSLTLLQPTCNISDTNVQYPKDGTHESRTKQDDIYAKDADVKTGPNNDDEKECAPNDCKKSDNCNNSNNFSASTISWDENDPLLAIVRSIDSNLCPNFSAKSASSLRSLKKFGRDYRKAADVVGTDHEEWGDFKEAYAATSDPGTAAEDMWTTDVIAQLVNMRIQQLDVAESGQSFDGHRMAAVREPSPVSRRHFLHPQVPQALL